MGDVLIFRLFHSALPFHVCSPWSKRLLMAVVCLTAAQITEVTAQFPTFGLRDATRRIRGQETKYDSLEAPKLRPPSLYGPAAALFQSSSEYGPFEAGAGLARSCSESRGIRRVWGGSPL